MNTTGSCELVINLMLLYSSALSLALGVAFTTHQLSHAIGVLSEGHGGAYAQLQ